MTPRILGIDPSLTSTGVAIDDLLIAIRTTGTSDDRLDVIYRHVDELAAAADYAVLEGSVLRTPSASLLGMVQGVVRLALQRHDVPYAVLAPATLKAFATGDGRADKPAMARAWFQHTGHIEKQPDKIDAAWLQQAGHYLFDTGHGILLPAEQVVRLHTAKMPPGYRNPIPHPVRKTHQE